jgi:hypothetical protein
MESFLLVVPTRASAQPARRSGLIRMLAGKAATKLNGLSTGPAVIARLSMVNAAPADGTVFDIVGHRPADPGGLLRAPRAAARLATRGHEPASAT